MAALAPHAGFWLLSRSRGCPNPAGSSIAGLTKGPSGAQVTALGGSQVPVLGGSLSRPGRGQKGKTSRAAAEPIAEAEGVEPEVLSELSQYLERELPLLFTPQVPPAPVLLLPVEGRGKSSRGRGREGWNGYHRGKAALSPPAPRDSSAALQHAHRHFTEIPRSRPLFLGF